MAARRAPPNKLTMAALAPPPPGYELRVARLKPPPPSTAGDEDGDGGGDGGAGEAAGRRGDPQALPLPAPAAYSPGASVVGLSMSSGRAVGGGFESSIQPVDPAAPLTAASALAATPGPAPPGLFQGPNPGPGPDAPTLSDVLGGRALPLGSAFERPQLELTPV